MSGKATVGRWARSDEVVSLHSQWDPVWGRVGGNGAH